MFIYDVCILYSCSLYLIAKLKSLYIIVTKIKWFWYIVFDLGVQSADFFLQETV